MSVNEHIKRKHFCIAGSQPCLARIRRMLALDGRRYEWDCVQGDDQGIARHVQSSWPQVVVLASVQALQGIRGLQSIFPDIKVVYAFCAEKSAMEEISQVILSEVDAILLPPWEGDSVRSTLVEVLEGRHSMKRSIHRLLKRFHATEALRKGQQTTVKIQRQIARHQKRLSPRQIEIMELICDGNSTKMIAEKLGIGEYTVSESLQIIRARLNAATGMQAAAQ